MRRVTTRLQSTCTVTIQVVSLYVLKKFFYCIFRQCRRGDLLLDATKQLKMGSGCVFPADPKYCIGSCGPLKSDSQERCAANTLSLRAFGIHHTFDMKRKVILKHDAIPTTFSEWEVKEGT